jgi:hypothetical protein
MSIRTTAPEHRRIRPSHEHVYTLPVVRELPAQPPGPLDGPSLW